MNLNESQIISENQSLILLKQGFFIETIIDSFSSKSVLTLIQSNSSD